jgi:RNA polymerase sigma factor (sigma-70 family)
MGPEVAVSDHELVALAAADDQSAFAALYERHLAALYDYARRLVRDADDAADVVQVAFIKAFDAIRNTGDTPRNFRPWLFQIAHNDAFDRLRRRRFVDPEGEAALAELADTNDAESPSAVAERSETAALVWHAVRGLRAEEQELLLLSVRQGLDAGEIATVIGKKRETVHVALSRARDAFADALTTLLLLTRGTRDCADLAALVGGLDFTPKLRRQVRRHVEQCTTCERKRREAVNELAVLAVLAPVQPPTDVQAALWQRISEHLSAGTGGPTSGTPNHAGPVRSSYRSVVRRLNSVHRLRGRHPRITLLAATMVTLGVLILAVRTASGLLEPPVDATTPTPILVLVPPTPTLALISASATPVPTQTASPTISQAALTQPPTFAPTLPPTDVPTPLETAVPPRPATLAIVPQPTTPPEKPTSELAAIVPDATIAAPDVATTRPAAATRVTTPSALAQTPTPPAALLNPVPSQTTNVFSLVGTLVTTPAPERASPTPIATIPTRVAATPTRLPPTGTPVPPTSTPVPPPPTRAPTSTATVPPPPSSTPTPTPRATATPTRVPGVPPGVAP